MTDYFSDVKQMKWQWILCWGSLLRCVKNTSDSI